MIYEFLSTDHMVEMQINPQGWWASHISPHIHRPTKPQRVLRFLSPLSQTNKLTARPRSPRSLESTGLPLVNSQTCNCITQLRSPRPVRNSDRSGRCLRTISVFGELTREVSQFRECAVKVPLPNLSHPCGGSWHEGRIELCLTPTQASSGYSPRFVTQISASDPAAACSSCSSFRPCV